MVVAQSWAEQRVLMRAFAGCDDQTRPTIVLHGLQLAIGPAGLDPAGPWGIHVEPPIDGRAQELRGQLELAARRLAGSRGTPPRLLDESSAFDNKQTNHWAPGAGRDVAQRPEEHWEPVQQASNPLIEARGASGAHEEHRRGWTPPRPTPPAREVGAHTTYGFASGAGAQSPQVRFGLAREPARRLAAMVGHTLPAGLRLTDSERAVLNALGSKPLTAGRVAALAGVDNGPRWMAALMSKLADHGLDLIAPGDDDDGEPTYLLRG